MHDKSHMVCDLARWQKYLLFACAW